MKARKSFPTPAPGLVIRYSYLWESEYRTGREEGRKDRPCAIVVSLLTDTAERQVVVLPVTHTPPLREEDAVEIPHTTKQRLNLDDERSWVILTEANVFSWPGPDLRPAINGDLSTIVYGLLPDVLFHKIRDKFVKMMRTRKLAVVRRTQ